HSSQHLESQNRQIGNPLRFHQAVNRSRTLCFDATRALSQALRHPQSHGKALLEQGGRASFLPD
ncbi:hypothetical protein NKI44_32160, partial [Mesorhizobium sp. M0614]|uniref:hypothetical protein n=1 Tax=Mesorhizobium sp. M0614 TaxID=2956970 RepID=UPI003335B28B